MWQLTTVTDGVPGLNQALYLQCLIQASRRPYKVGTVVLNGMGFKNSDSELKSDPLTYQLCDLGLLSNQFLVKAWLTSVPYS